MFRATVRGARAVGSARSFSTKVPLSVHEPTSYVQYDKMAEKLETVKKLMNRPLTYAEKVVYGDS